MTADTTPKKTTETSVDNSTSPAPRPGRSRIATDLALIAAFAALVAACALLPAIRVGVVPVPITLQTFAVLLAGAVLGARRGFLAVLLYVVAGAAGLPIFSEGRSGLGVLFGPSAGYLLGFPLAAALCGFIVERLPRETIARSVPVIFLAGIFSSFVFIHTFGVIGMAVSPQTDLNLVDAFKADLTFYPGDVIKNIAMAFVATAIHRAFPDLLPRRR